MMEGTEDIPETQTFSLMPLPQARSEVWKYFGFIANNDGCIVDKSRVICRLCAASLCYSGNTTNLYCHLRGSHSDVIPERNATHLTCQNTLVTSNTHNDRYDFQENHPTIVLLPKVVNDGNNKSNDEEFYIPKKLITQTLINFIVDDCRPVDILYGQAFQKFLKLVAPGYSLPRRPEILNNIRRLQDQAQQEKNNEDIRKILDG